MSSVYYNPNTKQYFTLTSNPQNQVFGINMGQTFAGANKSVFDTYVNRGYINLLGGPSQPESSQFNTASISRNYTPNQFTANQLAGMNGGIGAGGTYSTPQWMMDAYTRKIGSMGGNANPPIPFNVTPSGFPGGKVAPPQGGNNV